MLLSNPESDLWPAQRWTSATIFPLPSAPPGTTVSNIILADLRREPPQTHRANTQVNTSSFRKGDGEPELKPEHPRE